MDAWHWFESTDVGLSIINSSNTMSASTGQGDALVTSADPLHVSRICYILIWPVILIMNRTTNDQPANLISELCASFYRLGWVTGTGGGICIRTKLVSFRLHLTRTDQFPVAIKCISPPQAYRKSASSLPIYSSYLIHRQSRLHILIGFSFVAPSWTWKSLPALRFSGMLLRFVTLARVYTLILRTQWWQHYSGKKRRCSEFLIKWVGLVCCDHVVLILFAGGIGLLLFILPSLISGKMIKGVRIGGNGPTLSYLDTLEVPIIDNTPNEEDLKDSMKEAMEKFPRAAGILVLRHGIYVWGMSLANHLCFCMSICSIRRRLAESKNPNRG